MATTKQTVEKTPDVAGRSNVVARATFSAEGDVSNWVPFSGSVVLQAQGPVDAATIAIERSLVDPSGGAGLPVEVVDDTGAGGAGVVALAAGVGTAWYRAKNKATFGPASTVTNRSLVSLAAAINGQSSDNGFFPGTAAQPLVRATVAGLVMTLTAATPGTAGNAIATTETLANGIFSATTLLGGLEAVAASSLLTFSGQPAALDTVTVGGVTYTYVASLTGAANEVLRGASAAAARDNLLAAINLSAGTKATGTLTASANPAALSTVTIGRYTYTLVTALSSPNAPFEVVRDAATDTITLDRLVAAINSGVGAGTTYGALTPPNPDATAARSGSTIIATAVANGAAGNLVKVLENSAQLSWGATTLASATGIGVTYGLGTVINPFVTATTATGNMTATAKVAGVAGNAIATAEASSVLAWTGTFLASGAAAVAATGTLTMSGLPVTTNTVTVGAVVYAYATTPAALNQVAIAGLSIDVVLSGQQNVNV